jgi:hypothetical protein
MPWPVDRSFVSIYSAKPIIDNYFKFSSFFEDQISRPAEGGTRNDITRNRQTPFHLFYPFESVSSAPIRVPFFTATAAS